jgi:hypothetical protein
MRGLEPFVGDRQVSPGPGDQIALNRNIYDEIPEKLDGLVPFRLAELLRRVAKAARAFWYSSFWLFLLSRKHLRLQDGLYSIRTPP